MRALNVNQLGFTPVKDRSAARAAGTIFLDAVYVKNSYPRSIFSLGTRTYEVYVSGVGASTGTADVDIDLNTVASKDDIVDAMVAGIMGDASREVDAYDPGAGLDSVVVTARAEGTAGNAIVFTEDADPNNMFLVSGAGTLQGGQATAAHEHFQVEKAITTDEVTALAAGCRVSIGVITPGALPELSSLYLISAAGAVKASAGLIPQLTSIGGGRYLVAVDDGAAVLANGDTLRIVYEAA